ncbi:hypothetical protein M8C21_029472 [Ambrosia artemisiifolia]|uniref:WRKY domain-containing protein n=1 Tax=Ambrosia artemisiifolia TaxID=4212 RepID=A0AAD5GSG3_AMBAR|nr:hypothetical protein M8C21_029472 [Ambrosia artemisiifolia]
MNLNDHKISTLTPELDQFPPSLAKLFLPENNKAEWWEAELLEAVMEDLLFLPDIKILKLYLPTAKALQQFLRLERNKVPVYLSLRNYRFMTGHCEQLPFSVQLDAEEHFLKLEKCVKYMNGEGCSDEMMKLIRDARALYLRRHWNIDKLSSYDIRTLKYCLLMECNEMQTLVDQEDICRDTNSSTTPSEDEILGSLQYLSIHFMKKLQRISKGPIGRNSLSCLRILALHTCPELTSIFTECLLNNLQSLTEIIVEDCPKVNCLVDLEEGASWSNGPFLPKLRRVSLLHLPELVSVSGGVCIAPQLDTLLVFNCMKLDYLSDIEIPRDTMAIKGEREWWDALKYGKSTWEGAFVQLKRDGSLMDQLAEVTNSLQHFLELEMVPSVPGQVNQNSSTDIKVYREYVDQLKIDHNMGLSNETLKLKHGVRRKAELSKRIVVQETQDDGYIWRMYGRKEILGAKYPREYYRCSFKSSVGCHARKQVQKSTEYPHVFEVCYIGKHICHTALSNHSSSVATESACIDTNSHFELAKRPQMLDSNRKKSIITRDSKGTQQLKARPSDSSTASESASVITDSRFELAQRPQMLDSNRKLSVTSDYTCESESALSILKGCESSVTIESEVRSLKYSGSSTTAESSSTITDNSLGLNYTKKMSGSASIQSWKQQMEEIQSPSLKSQLPLSYELNMILSEIAENGSRNLSSSTKTAQNAKQCHPPGLKVKREKLSDRIVALQQLVSPFGKTDTASLLFESCEQIRFLHEQVKVLTTPNIKQGTPFESQKQALKQDLRREGLCLVPVSSALLLTNQTTTDFSSPTLGNLTDEPNAYKTRELFPHSGVL